MKFIKIITISCLLFIVVGCSNNQNNESEKKIKKPEFKYEETMNLEILSKMVFNRIAPCETGIYYVTGYYIYFYDYDTGIRTPLCNKPNCKHDKETDQLIGQECNAYTENGSYGGILDPSHIRYHNGYIYMLQNKIDFQTGLLNVDQIVRINKDGTNREVVYELNRKYNISDFHLHLGKLYLKVKRKGAENFDKLLEIDLKSGDSKEILEGQANRFISYFLKDQYLYFNCEEFKNNEKTYYDVIVRYDLNSDNVEIIYEGLDKRYSNFSLINDNIYAIVKNSDTYIYDALEDKEFKLCDEFGNVAVGENLIFVHNGFGKLMAKEGEKTVSVFDKNFEFIDKFKLEDDALLCDSGVINNELFYYYKTDEDTTERIYRLYLNDQNKLQNSIFSEVHPSQNKIGGYVTYE